MAKQDNESFTYICGKCHGEIGKDDNICPHCGVKLGKIKCPYCGFTGDADKFRNDRCPQCGKHTVLSLTASQPHYYRSSNHKMHNTPPASRHGYSNYKIGCIIMSVAFIISVIIFIKYFNII